MNEHSAARQAMMNELVRHPGWRAWREVMEQEVQSCIRHVLADSSRAPIDKVRYQSGRYEQAMAVMQRMDAWEDAAKAT